MAGRSTVWHKISAEEVASLAIEHRPTSLGELCNLVQSRVGVRVTPDALRGKILRWRGAGERIGRPSELLSQPAPADWASSAVAESRLERTVRELRERERALVRELEAARSAAELSEAVQPRPSPIAVSAKVPKGIREGYSLALYSDWHLEEIVDPAKVAGRNEYSPTIAQARATRCFQRTAKLVELCRRGWRVKRAGVWLGGDFISNAIHDELEETNAMRPLEAIEFARDVLVGGLEFLARELKLDQLDVFCNDGNHDRMTDKIRHKSRSENSLGTHLYRTLARDFRSNKKVRFDVAVGEHLYTEVYGRRIRFTHGDSTKYQGGVGGLSIPLRKAVSAWDTFQPADVTVMGHWHQLSDFGFAVVNGSLIGYSEYSLAIKATYEPPRQTFLVFDQDHGKALVAPIWVS